MFENQNRQPKAKKLISKDKTNSFVKKTLAFVVSGLGVGSDKQVTDL